MNPKLEEVTDEILEKEIDEMLEKSEQEFWTLIIEPPEAPMPSEERIKRIKKAVELARLEQVAAEVTDFYSNAGEGLKAVLDTLATLSKRKPPTDAN